MMLSPHRNGSRQAAIALSFLALFRQVPALTVEYCSSLNTASSGPTYWIYQSNGWCHDHCVSDYAFAIVQGFNCWCSDYAPGTTTSASNCNTKCPGYTELCGGNGVYGYIALNKAPVGTKGASDDGSASSTVQQVTVTAAGTKVTVTAVGAPVTIFATVTPPPASSQISSTSSTYFTLNSDGSTSTTSDSSTSMSWIPTPVTSVETVTGQVRTVTITPTAPPTSADNTGLTQTGSSGLNTVQAVGLTIGLVALVAVIGAVIFFIIRKRRQGAVEQFNDDPVRTDSSSGPLPKRTMSENSRFMLGTDGRQVVEGWEQEPEMAGSRRSRLVPVDPRLDPFAPVYQRGDGSKSRESVTTIRDDHDYSRRVHQGRPILRATNPDPSLDE